MKKKILYLFIASLFICSFMEAKSVTENDLLPVVKQGTGDDSYEPNNTLSAAYTNLTVDTWLSSIGGLGVQADDDWYKIEVVAGYDRLQITCTFIDDDGDIDLVLYNSSGAVVKEVMSITNNEFIDIPAPSPGDYYIKVWRRNSADPDNSYDLWWDLPLDDDDAYEENDSLITAYTGLPKATWLSSVYGLGLQCDNDWYRINVSDPVFKRIKIECIFTHSEGDIDLTLYDANGDILLDVYSETDNESIDITVDATGYYYVCVWYWDTGNSYDLWWDTLVSSAVTLSSIHITGYATVNENTNSAYTCTATWSDTTTSDVSDDTTWSENSAYSTINSSGILTANNVSSDQSVTITAVYGGKSTTKAVTIKDVPPTVVSLVIAGPASVDENTVASYTCTATWSDSSTSDVTGTASWSENSAYAEISSSGVLTAESVSSNQTVTVFALYGGSSANKMVTIVFTGAPLSYTDWTVLEGIPVGQRDHSATPVNDGIPNLLKYACGLPALQQCTTDDLMTIAVNDGSSTFAINFSYFKRVVNVDLDAVWAPSLTEQMVTNDVIYQITGEDDKYQYRRGSISLGESGFMRLRATPVESDFELE